MMMYQQLLCDYFENANIFSLHYSFLLDKKYSNDISANHRQMID